MAGRQFCDKTAEAFFLLRPLLVTAPTFFPLLARVRPPNKRPFAALLTHPDSPHGQSLRYEISFLQKRNFLNISRH